MARKVRYNFNIDKLKLCLNTPPTLFVELSQQMDEAPIFYSTFFLFITDNGRGKDNDKEPLQITADLYLDEQENDKHIKMGTFIFFNSNKYDGRSFFEFDNRIFYKASSFGHSYIGYFNYILEEMGFEVNNNTQIDIAGDTTANATKTILDYIKDHENKEMIYKGRAVTADEELEDFGEFFTRKRAKRNKYPTLYFQHKKADGLSMRIYNKSKEIEQNSDKKYIDEWNKHGKANTHRVEITIRNEEWKKFIAYLIRECVASPEALDNLNAFNLATMEGFLESAFAYTSEKLLYFRVGGRKVTLLDIIKGEG